MSDYKNTSLQPPSGARMSWDAMDAPAESSFAAPAGSVASPYVVRRRKSDNRWCIYLREYNCVVAEFGAASSYDAETIKEILEGTKPLNAELCDRR